MSHLIPAMPGPLLLVIVALATLALSELAWRVGMGVDARRGSPRAKSQVPCLRVVWTRLGVAVVSLGAGLWAALVMLLDPGAAAANSGVLLASGLGVTAAGLLAPRACATLEHWVSTSAQPHLGAGEDSSGAGGSITDQAA